MGDVGDPAIRAAVVGTGNAGRLALAQVIADPHFDLVAVGVHSPEKVGLDAATIAGAADTTGVVATEGLDAVIAASPQCVVYCPMGDTRPIEATADVVRLLSAGIHVVGSAPGPLQYPWGAMPPKVIDKVATAALDHDAAVFITGVDPGFVSDLIPLAFSGTCQHVEQICCMEIADYATYDGTEVMVDVMGFGAPLDQTPMLFLPGILGLAWGTSLHQIAAAMDVTIDEIVERHESEPTSEDFEVATGTIANGTRAAVRFEIIGMVDGKPGIVIERVTRLRGDLRPDWAQPAQPGGCYRVQITGEPSYRIDICPTSRKGDHNHAAIVAAAGRIVNAIPAVVAGPAGIRTTLDLPLISEPRLTPTALT